jgi:antitoxin ParD1/3/4
MDWSKVMKPAGQMSLTLTVELEQFVKNEVKKGAYASSSEYVRDLVRERYMQSRADTDRWAAFDAALDRGIADAEAGRVMEVDEAFRRLRDALSGTR